MSPRNGSASAVALLESQHDDVEDLFEQIKAATTDGAKSKLFIELADTLAAHAKIEETIFYPAVLARQTEDLLLESAEEDLSIKRVLADVLELDIDDEQFDAKLSVMQEQVEQHAREKEEGELFPKVKVLFTDHELVALGSEMLAKFEELLGGKPRLQVKNHTDVAASFE
jgi:hemerythrin superfamily protein